jgi:uncharacterized protein (TIGR03437 family)
MRMLVKRMSLVVCLMGATTPVLLWGFSSGPVIMRTGAAVDGGLDCTACHRTFAPANSDPRGRLAIFAAPYSPGVKQNIRILLEHPEAQRWGFQLTARLVSDETKQAGTFTVSEEVRARCGPDGRDGPCNGAVEFVEHTAFGTRVGITERTVWIIEWTPPATDAGDVIFYAAGNAANNNNTNAGDRIYTTASRISGPCNLTGLPAITGVLNAASFQPGINFNSMISIFGSGFAPAGTTRLASSADLLEGRTFPSELSCIGVEVGGRRAPITFISPNQINVQAPTSPVLGPVEVRVLTNPGRPNEARSGARTGVPQQAHAPAFFTFFSNGRNIAAQHTNFDLVADPSLLPGGRPAAPGDVVILYGTGFGLTEPLFLSGAIADRQARLRDPFAVTVAGVSLRPEDILYAGLSPGSISGLYQFNVRLPLTVPDGDVPVSIEIGGQRTQNGATIRVRRP